MALGLGADEGDTVDDTGVAASRPTGIGAELATGVSLVVTGSRFLELLDCLLNLLYFSLEAVTSSSPSL